MSDSNESPNPAFAQAAGYVTDSHDQVLHGSGRVVGECWTQTDAIAIANELNRLKSDTDIMCQVLQRIADMEPHVFKGEHYSDSDAAREVLSRCWSHNDKLTDEPASVTKQTKGN